MTNLELLNKIKAAIERLKAENRNIRCQHNENYCTGYDDAFNDLLPVINSLSEENPSEELEEAAENCVWNSIDSNDPTLVPKFIPLLLSLFISGAYWQKEQMMKDLEEDALLLERAWLTLDGFGHEELAERLRKLKEKIC